MKKIVTFLAAFVLVAFAVLVVRETAAVVALARDVHPTLGAVTLWGLLTVYAVCLGVPVALFLRLPRPLEPPPGDDDALERHLARLARRLRGNPHLAGAEPATDGRAAVERALAVLEARANEEIRREGSLVFLSTALSQSGRLDALFVLVVQARLVWKIARVYRQRPGGREMLRLYASVAATVFAAQALEDLELAEVVEPLVPPLLEAAGVGATVVLAPVATILADSLMQGTVNSLLTFRVGCIARRYSSGMPLPDARAVRKAAAREAAAMLGGVAVDLGRAVSVAVWDSALRLLSGRARTAAGRAASLVTGGPLRAAMQDAIRKVVSARPSESEGPA